MPDDDVLRLVRAARVLDPAADAISVAEAIWLAAHRAPAADRAAGSTDDVGHDRVVNRPSDAVDDDGSGPADHRAARAGQALYDLTPGTGGDRARRIGIGRARALPRSLDLARGLRPFKRAWRDGRHLRLDLDATVDHYAETGHLVPVLRPAPERWFDVVLVVDGSPGMVVWEDVVGGLARVLAQVGAFRTVRLLGFDPADGVPAGGLRVPDARQLIIVFTDCSADAWQYSAAWRIVRRWAESTPTVLINPLPVTLWHHAGLDLPAVRVRTTVPGVTNRSLSYRLPPLLRATADPGERWLAVPVAGLTAHSLNRLAMTLMRGHPAGCDAVLTSERGRPPDAGENQDTEPEVEADPAALVTSFQRFATPAAGRIAALAATWETLTLPLLRLIAERMAPDADVEDLGAVIAGGLFTVDGDHDVPVLTFRPGVGERLQQNLRVDDVRQMYAVMGDHITARTGSPDRLRIAVRDPRGTVALPARAAPFTVLSREAVRVLGIEPSDDAPPPGSIAAPAADIVILTMMPAEFMSVSRALGNSRSVRWKTLTARLADVDGRRVAVVRLSPGGQVMAVEVTRVVRLLNPAQVLIVGTAGVAGAGTGPRPGDVLVAQNVVELEETTPSAARRLEFHAADAELLAAAQRAAAHPADPTGLPDPAVTAIHFGNVVGEGGRVLVTSRDVTVVGTAIRDVLGWQFEASAVFALSRAGVRCLLVCGVVDVADRSKDDQREYADATDNAAAFAVRVLRQPTHQPGTAQARTSETTRSRRLVPPDNSRSARPSGNPFALGSGGPLPLSPLINESDLDLYVDVGNAAAAFERFTVECPPAAVMQSGRTVVVTGPPRSGKTSLINRCVDWLFRRAREDGLTPSMVYVSDPGPQRDHVEARVQRTVTRMASFLTESGHHNLDAGPPIDPEPAGSVLGLSRQLVAAAKLVIVLLPETESADEIRRYEELTSPGFLFLLETNAAKGAPAPGAQRSGLRASGEGPDRALVLTLTTIGHSDALRYISQRLVRHGPAGIPWPDSGLIERLASTEDISVGELGRLLYVLYDEFEKRGQPIETMTWDDVMDVYHREFGSRS